MHNLSLFLFLLCALGGRVQAAEQNYWQSLVVDINNQLDVSAKSYQKGDVKAANRGVIKAYFGIFEGKKLESAMRMELGAKYTYLVEKQFSTLRKTIKSSGAPEIFNARVTSLKNELITDAAKLDRAQISAAVFGQKE